MFRKHKGTLTLQDLYSDEIVQLSLEKLQWEHVENNKKCYESTRISQVGSKMTELLLRSLLEKGKVKFGNFSYEAEHNRLIRHGPSIKSKAKPENKLFTLGKIYKQWIDVDKDDSVRIVNIK